MSEKGTVSRVREDLVGQLAAFGSMPGERELEEAERRRDLGLPVLPADPAPRSAAHECSGGWLADDGGGCRPCLKCKPHLSPVDLGGGLTGWRVKR